MATNLRQVAVRKRLQPRRDPYYEVLEEGLYLGFRKMTAATDGTWLARWRDPRTNDKPQRSLGKFDDRPEAERYDAAAEAARAWVGHLRTGGVAEPITVRRACERYVERLRREKGESAAQTAQERIARLVEPDRIADVQVLDLRKSDLVEWRERLAATPADVTRGKSKADRTTRARSPVTINRDMAVLRAGLNLALEDGHASTDAAWRTALKAIKADAVRREVYLDLAQRKALIDAAPAQIAPFLRGLCLLPLRPGALASLRVESFDKRRSTLAIGRDKNGKARTILLPAEAAALMLEQSRSKLPGAPLFARPDGRAWDKDAWKGPVKDAALAAGLPAATSAYALRHSTITDLVTGGLPLLTVAQISGTSAAMIERHYGHFQQEHARAALAELAL
jgi:integrase